MTKTISFILEEINVEIVHDIDRFIRGTCHIKIRWKIFRRMMLPVNYTTLARIRLQSTRLGKPH